ncbi:hypothetical protein ACRAWF_21985 [Streptomyces sp. L7]
MLTALGAAAGRRPGRELRHRAAQANARFRALAGVSGGSCLVYAAAVTTLVRDGRDLPLLAVLAAGRYLLMTVGGLCAGARHPHPAAPAAPAAERRDFGSYAVRMQLSGFTVFLNGEIDALVVAALLPVRYVGVYAAGYQAAMALRSVPLFAFPPILTRMTLVFARYGLPGAVREFHALQACWSARRPHLRAGAVTTASGASPSRCGSVPGSPSAEPSPPCCWPAIRCRWRSPAYAPVSCARSASPATRRATRGSRRWSTSSSPCR